MAKPKKGIKNNKAKASVKKDDQPSTTPDENFVTVPNVAENVDEQNESTENEGTENSSGEGDGEATVKGHLPQENKRENKDKYKENIRENKDKDNLLGKDKDQTGGHHTGNPLHIYILILSIFAFVIMYLFSKPSTIQVGDIDIEPSLKKLENDFPNQSSSSYRKLRSRAMSYIHHRTSPQPFVLLVASTQDDQLTAKCFATRVAEIFGTSSVTINGSTYTDAGSDNAKKVIDDHLRNVFKKGKFPTTAIIHNFDSIPYGTTNLFYAYCDHDHPMYKEAAIIFTVTLPQNYQVNEDEVDREGLVEKYLSEDSLWAKDKTFSVDVMGALISRITDTVIVVNKESSESLEKFC